MPTNTRPGGRTERTRTAVLDAAFAIAAESGYGGLTVDAIAARSGVHKTTIYRRWGSVDAILFDAIVSRAQAAIPLTSTGDTRADLIAMAVSVVANLEDPVAMAVAGAVMSRTGEGNLSDLSDRFWQDRITRASAIVAMGQRDGRVDPDLEPSTVIEKIIGPIWFRVMILRSGVDEEFVESLVDSAIR